MLATPKVLKDASAGWLQCCGTAAAACAGAAAARLPCAGRRAGAPRQGERFGKGQATEEEPHQSGKGLLTTMIMTAACGKPVYLCLCCA